MREGVVLAVDPAQAKLSNSEFSNHQRTWSSSWHMILRKHLKSEFPVKQLPAFSTGPMSLGLDKNCTREQRSIAVGGINHRTRFALS
jgi:hypothetical protein